MDEQLILHIIEYVFPSGTVAGLLGWWLKFWTARRKEAHANRKDDRDDESVAVSTMKTVVSTVREEFVEITKQLDKVQLELAESKTLVKRLTDENKELHDQIATLSNEINTMRADINKRPRGAR